MIDLQKRILTLLKQLKRDAAPWNQRDRDAVEQISSSVETLISAALLTVESRTSAIELLRSSFPPMYKKFRSTSLQLSVSVFSFIIRSKVATAYKVKKDNHLETWQLLAEAIINGVLDFFESLSEAETNSELKLDIGKIYYAEICKLFFSFSFAVPWTSFSLNLRVATYTLLTYTAQYCTPNQEKLRKLLGSENLGSVIVSTKDVLALDELLNVLATLIPVTKAHADGRERRMKFVRECFLLAPIHHSRGEDIVRILEHVSSSNWEETSEQIIDTLAKELEFPQPLVFDTFYVSGLANPHPEPIKRCYLDGMSMLFNCVNNKDNTLEISVIPYRSIRRISISEMGTVSIELSSPPIYHKAVLQAAAGISTSSILMTLTFADDQINRFVQTLRCRRLEKLAVYNGTSLRPHTNRVSVNKSSTRLEFDDDGRAISQSYEEKVKIVEDGVQQLGDPGDDAPLGDDFVVEDGRTVSQMAATVTLNDGPDPLPHLPATSIAVAAHSLYMPAQALPPSVLPPSSPSKSNLSELSKLDAQLHEVLFGSGDDDLSDLSDVESTGGSRPVSRTSSKKVTRLNHLPDRDNLPAREPVERISSRPMTPKPKLKARGRRAIDSQDAEGNHAISSPKEALRKKRAVYVEEDEGEEESSTLKPASLSLVPAIPLKGHDKKVDTGQVKGTRTKNGGAKPDPLVEEKSTGEAPSKPAGRRGRPTRASAAAASKKIAAIGATSTSAEITSQHASASESMVSPSVVKRDAILVDLSNDDSKALQAKATVPLLKKPPVQSHKQPANVLKRKREVLDDEEEAVSGKTPPDSLPTRSPAKRARTEAREVDQPDNRPKRSEFQVAKQRTTATTRTKKKYGNRPKKDRESTPSAVLLDDVNYDEIPGATPTSKKGESWSEPFEVASSSPAKVPVAGAKSKVLEMKAEGGKGNTTTEITPLKAAKKEPKPTSKWKKVEKEMKLQAHVDEEDPILPASSPVPLDIPPAHGDDRMPSLISNVVSFGQSKKVTPTTTPVKKPPQRVVKGDATRSLSPSSMTTMVPEKAVTRPELKVAPILKAKRPPAQTKTTNSGNSPQHLDTRFRSTSAKPPSNNATTSTPILAACGTEESPINLILNDLDESTMVIEPSQPPSASVVKGKAVVQRQRVKPKAEVKNKSTSKKLAVATKPPSPKTLADVEMIDLTRDTLSPLKKSQAKGQSVTVTLPPLSHVPQTSENDLHFNFEEDGDTFEDKHEDYQVMLDTSLGLPSFDLEPARDRQEEEEEREAALEDICESTLPRLRKNATVSFAPLDVKLEEYAEVDEDILLSPKEESRVELREDWTTPAMPGQHRPELSVPESSFTRLSPLPVQEKQPRDRLFENSTSTPKRAEAKRKRQLVDEPPDESVDTFDARLDEIATVIKDLAHFVANQVREGFNGIRGDVLTLRHRFLRQVAQELREINDENVKTYNELLALEGAYGDYSMKKAAAFRIAAQLAEEGCWQVENIIKEHDRRASHRAKKAAVVPPLPASILKWIQ